jgi:hypothetical protein
MEEMLKESENHERPETARMREEEADPRTNPSPSSL